MCSINVLEMKVIMGKKKEEVGGKEEEEVLTRMKVWSIRSQSLHSGFQVSKRSYLPPQFQPHSSPAHLPHPFASSVPATFIFVVFLNCTRHTPIQWLSLNLFSKPQMLYLQIFAGMFSLVSLSVCSNVTFSTKLSLPLSPI